MSYISPERDVFSNPALSCTGSDSATYPCGIDENDPTNAANNSLSLNNVAADIAAFVRLPIQRRHR